MTNKLLFSVAAHIHDEISTFYTHVQRVGSSRNQIESSGPAETVRRVHFETVKTLGLKFSKLCLHSIPLVYILQGVILSKYYSHVSKINTSFSVSTVEGTDSINMEPELHVTPHFALEVGTLIVSNIKSI